MSNKYLETKRYKLIAISPVHIKSGEAGFREYGQGFIRLVGDKNNIYVIDAPKLQEKIYDLGGLNAVIEFTKKINENNFSVAEFLQNYNFRLNKDTIKSISKGIVYSKQYGKEISKFISNGFDECFIPGSSIKGALKTAVLYEMLKNQDEYLHNLLVDQLNKYDQKKYEVDNERVAKRKRKLQIELNKLKEGFAKRIIKEYIHDTTPLDINKKTEVSNPTLQSKDFFRAVKISDSSVFSVVEKNIGIMTLNKNNTPQWKTSYGKSMEIKAEIMQVQTETLIEISIDHYILNSFKNKTNIPFSNLDELIQLSQNFAQRLWEFEYNYIKTFSNSTNFNLSNIRKYYSQNIKPTMRLGWGSGLLGTTVNLLLSEEMRQDLRNTIYVNRQNQPAPKSRRFVKNYADQPELPLGWIRLEEM